MQPGETISPRGVVVVEPPLDRRARRPADLVRLMISLLVLALPLIAASYALRTTGGLEQDLVKSTTGLPKLALTVVTFAAGVGVLALPVGLSLDLLLRRRVWQLLDAFVAAMVGGLVAFGLRTWIVHAEPGRLLNVLTKELNPVTHARSAPVQGFLVAIVAFLTLAQLSGRRVWEGLAALSVGSVAIFGVVSGSVTAMSIVFSLSLGWTVGLAVRYAIGAGSTRPPGTDIADTLLRLNITVNELRRIVEETIEPRRYLGTLVDGGEIRVNVLDRDTYGSAVLYRLWRRLRLRGPATRRSFLTVRSAIDHEALLALAATDAGVPTPRLLAVAEVGSDASLVAYANVPGVSMHALTAPGNDEHQGSKLLTDQQLRGVWESLQLLQARQIAHRGLTPENILFADDGRVVLLGMSSGEVAAGDLPLRLDTAQLLTTIALRVGAERAVQTAIEVLGPEPLIDALPFLQGIVLARATRAELKQHKGLLHSVRDQIIAVTPADGEVEEAKLERLSLRMVIAVVGGSIAAYVLLTQLTQFDLGEVVAKADWRWAGFALACSFVTYVGAAMTTVGFVSQKVSFVRATLTQFAVSFTGLVAPTAVGAVALNVRFLQCSGVDPAVAVSSVGLVQLGMFVSHVVLLVLFGVLAGTSTDTSFAPPQGAVIGFLVVVVGALVGLSLPVGRRLLQSRLRPLVGQVVPRLVAVFQRPSKLLTGLGGALLLNVAYVAALAASVLAFGGHLSIPAVAVVYLAGSVVGSAVPTPGGLGGVEAALSAGLTAAGLEYSVALSAVLLFRLVTFWIPIPLGWGAINYLQRQGAL